MAMNVGVFVFVRAHKRRMYVPMCACVCMCVHMHVHMRVYACVINTKTHLRDIVCTFRAQLYAGESVLASS